MATTKATDPIQLAREVVETFNRSDWSALRGCLASNVVYEETGTGRRVSGVDAYIQLCQGWKTAFADVAGDVRRHATNGGTVALEITWEGTHTGPLTGPGGTIPPTGKRAPVPATMWIETANGKVTTVRHHLDLLALLQAIGAMPQPAGAGAS